MNLSSCVHPRCDDGTGTGNHVLTTQHMCDHCRNRLNRQLGWLIEDYVTLKTELTQPGSGSDTTRRTTRQAFGHPAEWASDTCRDIAGLLNDAEDQLRAQQGDPPALYVAPETVKVRDARTYLQARWDDFCESPNVGGFAGAVIDTHAVIRGALGLTKFAQRLPTPCPSCDIAALTRYISHIECGSCGRIIREDDYPLFTRIATDAALDALIEDYDTRAASFA